MEKSFVYGTSSKKRHKNSADVIKTIFTNQDDHINQLISYYFGPYMISSSYDMLVEKYFVAYLGIKDLVEKGVITYDVDFMNFIKNVQRNDPYGNEMHYIYELLDQIENHEKLWNKCQNIKGK